MHWKSLFFGLKTMLEIFSSIYDQFLESAVQENRSCTLHYAVVFMDMPSQVEAVIFNYCVRAHWWARRGLQVCQGALEHSTRNLLKTLPDSVVLFPGSVAGGWGKKLLAYHLWQWEVSGQFGQDRVSDVPRVRQGNRDCCWIEGQM